MRFIPFTAHIKVLPFNGKRFETIRDLQKISEMVYNGIVNTASVNVATPGGGQHRNYTGTEAGGLSGYVNGCAVKPQFGQTPAQLMITGFYEVSSKNLPTYSDKEVLHTGQDLEGIGSHSYDATPQAAVDAGVKALKTALESAIDTEIGGLFTYQIFRMDYNGVLYGDRGFHFPR